MNVYSYVITHDAGFAPNPFGGFLTLATCKPKIRLRAHSGDFIVGTGSTATVGNMKMVYAAKVDETVTLEEYGQSPEYEVKKPSMRGESWRMHGDNIYFAIGETWKQRRNRYHQRDAMEHDLGGKNALVCKHFWYFGSDAIEIPPNLQSTVKKGPGHKRILDPIVYSNLTRWLESIPEGIHGQPEMKI